MPGSTPNLNLYLPGGGSTAQWTPDETADIDPLNQNFVDIDEAIGDPDEQNRNWFGPAASLAIIPDRPPRKGDTYTASDTSQVWRHTGSNWVSAEGGLYLIRPTSVVNGTLNADGSVTPSTTLSAFCELQGVFSTRFKFYRIVGYIKGTVGDSAYFRWMSGSTMLSAANSYNNGSHQVDSAGNGLNTFTNNSFGRIVGGTSTDCTFDMNVACPIEADVQSRAYGTAMLGNTPVHFSSGAAAVASHDGIAFSRNGQSITDGQIRVYGFG